MDAVRFEGSEPILAVPGDPFRANSGGWRFPKVNLGYAFLATSGRKTLNRDRHFVPGCYRAVSQGQNTLEFFRLFLCSFAA